MTRFSAHATPKSQILLFNQPYDGIAALCFRMPVPSAGYSHKIPSWAESTVRCVVASRNGTYLHRRSDVPQCSCYTINSCGRRVATGENASSIRAEDRAVDLIFTISRTQIWGQQLSTPSVPDLRPAMRSYYKHISIR